MKCTPVVIQLSPHYSAKINKYPNPNLPEKFNSTLHWHKEIEIIYVIKGRLVISCPQNDVALNSKDIYLLNTEDIHAYTSISPDAQFISVNFLPSIIQSYTENPSVVPTFKLKNNKAVENIKNSLIVLNSLDRFDRPVDIPKIKSLLNKCAYYLVKYCYEPDLNYVKGSQSQEYNFANLAISYINENFRQRISLNDISSYVGLTPAHFSKIFRENTGITFSNYLKQVRLESAVNTLMTTNESVKSAALNNGFSNINAFTTACKEAYGKTPHEIKSAKII